VTRPLTLSPSDEMRLFLGCLAQPFLAAVLTFLTFPLIDYSHGGRTSEPLEMAAGLALAVALAAAVIALCALPVAVWMVKRTTVGLEHALLFGAGFGNLPAVVGLLAGTLSVRAVALGTFLGISGAALFWVIAIRGRVFDQSRAAD
jgi:hypothetical protein